MAYNANNLNLCSPRMGEGENLANAGYSAAMWVYRDITANDNLAAMQASGFISDADDQGIRVGDLVCFIEDTVDASWALVSVITAGAADTIILSNP